MSPNLLLSIALLLVGQATLTSASDARAATANDTPDETAAARTGDDESTAAAAGDDEASAAAAEGTPTGIADDATVDEALAEEIRAGEAARAAASPNDETFVPSVQISEDLSVSFPVDI